MVILSDVSNPLRPVSLALKWSDAYYVEVLAQGRKEKEDGNAVQDKCDPDIADKVVPQVTYWCYSNHTFLL